MDKIPKVSVIIPTFNRARYVTEAIDSVLGQSFTDYEIIVIDDGSIDNTREAIQPYYSKIIYIFQENKGVSAARNTGIKAAKGEWIAFLDSDDEWLPHKLEQQMKDLKQYPDAVLSCSNVTFESQDGMPTLDYFGACLHLDMKQAGFVEEPLFKSYACTPTVVALRSLIQAVGGFDEELTIYEDIDLFLRLSLVGGFTVNPTILVKTFRRNESEDLNLSIKALNDRIKNHTSLIRIFTKILKNQLTAKQRFFVQEKLSSSWFDLAMENSGMKNSSQARKCFLRAYVTNPTFKNLLKFLVGLSGRAGICFIERKRKLKKGFRRSEYYQNETNN